MKIRIWGILLVVAALTVGLVGCYGGGSIGLNPTMTLDFPAGTPLPNWSASSVLVIEGEAKTADEANAIATHQWTQSPANAGTFSSTSTFSTTWQSAPVPVGTTRNVTLYLTVTTRQGGKSVMPINLIVTP